MPRSNQRASRASRAVPVGLLMLALLGGRSLAGQVGPRSFSWGLTGGPAFLSQSLEGHLSKLGPAASVFASWSLAPRVAVSAEVLASHFGVSIDHVHGPCAPETDPFACHDPVGPVDVGAFAAGIQLADSTVSIGSRGSYLLVGGGLYRALRHPTASGATRFGWTAGFGFVLRPTTPRFALEVRYHQIPRWPDDRVSLIPVTLALSW